MASKRLEYIKEWRRKNKDKVKQYNKKTMENKIKKEVEKALKEKESINDI